ncbi:hypothetical protein H1C71_018557 [Ictidomys tridecemlineatus]|nr:hypothetical protein H1C71_018557 [Ictidomys tridecemlineatus]
MEPTGLWDTAQLPTRDWGLCLQGLGTTGDPSPHLDLEEEKRKLWIISRVLPSEAIQVPGSHSSGSCCQLLQVAEVSDPRPHTRTQEPSRFAFRGPRLGPTHSSLSAAKATSHPPPPQWLALAAVPLISPQCPPLRVPTPVPLSPGNDSFCQVETTKSSSAQHPAASTRAAGPPSPHAGSTKLCSEPRGPDPGRIKLPPPGLCVFR